MLHGGHAPRVAGRDAKQIVQRPAQPGQPDTIVGPVGGVIGRAAIIDKLKYIRCPTLVLTGDEDHTTPPAQAERIVSQIAGARLVRLANCGHSSAIEAPEAVNHAIAEFLASVDTAGTTA